ncbi:M56 family metallopeptidase [Sporichthya sp.]|uniref:M56 family metallopeptidase n=1 Tax=Sporichthya sp. TaxID=65475 RepID=UPI0017F09799|nr:M56 family metallopeptidase [Sporichthya sp.]MBA3741617.1 M56 family metallopeptidase [Sporichthya sp.]
MTDSLVLLAYAIGAGTAGAALLRRCAWPQRAPRLGVAAWQALSGSVVLALLLAGITAVVPLRAIVTTNPAEVLHTCLMALRAQYDTLEGAVLHATGLAATLGFAARVTYLLTTGLRDARRLRREHLTRLHLVAHRDCTLDAFIVDHPTAAAYCVPGREGTIVLTTAAVSALGPDELAAVLAHERAHLRGRHHLVLAGAAALAGTMPLMPGLRWAQAEQARLLEMIADDDDAAVGAGRFTVASALVHLAEGSVPAMAMGAADIAAVARVRRLVNPAHRLGLAHRAAIGAAVVVTAAMPIAIAATPAWAATHAGYCSAPTLDRTA